MRTVQLAGRRAWVAGGPDREGGGDGPVVVLLHGFGAPGHDLVPLWRVLDVPREVRFVFPEAVHELGGAYGEGRCWWPIDMVALDAAMRRGETRNLSQQEPDGLVPAREHATLVVEEVLATLAPKDGALFLGGFSQGAMLACELALSLPALPLRGLVLMSGTLLAEPRWTQAAKSRKGLNVVQSHGREDPLLPFSQAEALRDLLTSAGLSVEFLPFRGGHEIPSAVLDAVGKMISMGV